MGQIAHSTRFWTVVVATLAFAVGVKWADQHPPINPWADSGISWFGHHTPSIFDRPNLFVHRY